METVALIKHADKSFSLPVVAGAGDIKNPRFDVHIIDTTKLERDYHDCLKERESGGLNDHLYEYDSLDAALGNLVRYWNRHDTLSRYADGHYRIIYRGHQEDIDGYVLIIDFGDPIYRGRICIR